MKQMIGKISKHRTLFLILTIVTVSILTVSFKPAQDDYFFKVNKSLDILGHVYKEISINYVDAVDPSKFMESGIDGLLATLDPYTNFISETEGDEVDLITNGAYGGIGVTIGVRDGYITVMSVMEGYSAQQQGILPGDRILAIDGKPVIGTKPDAIRPMTRGEVGTEVHLKIERDGEAAPLEFTVIREQVQVKNVSYADFIEQGTAYIKLEHFSRNAGEEVRMAIQDLKLKGPINGIILDLRDNPGGLLDAAVDVVEKFVPRGSLIVSTKGRQPESEKKYFSTEDPILPNTPMVVLTNHGSASASEIVAGAIQDLDRGVIMGTRSFGKGLVQTITPLPYNTQLKITTAKYYTPSGRCIQEIDYSRRDTNGSFAITADSARHEFKTISGRHVYEHGGITPDSIIELPQASTLNRELLRKLIYFKFATKYAGLHKNDLNAFETDSTLLGQFKNFIEQDGFTYQDDGEKKVLELQQIAGMEKYGSSVRSEIEHLQRELVNEKVNAFQKHLSEIKHELMAELATRSSGEKGRIAMSAKDDIQINGAESVLSSSINYDRLLTLREHGK
ncbi:MAG: S41 family peptidase [Bacteroidota bacterium]